MTDVTPHPNEIATNARALYRAAMAELKRLDTMGYTVLVGGNSAFKNGPGGPALAISKVYQL